MGYGRLELAGKKEAAAGSGQCLVSCARILPVGYFAVVNA